MPGTPSKGGRPAFLQLRVDPRELTRWKRTAKRRGVYLSELIRELLNQAAQHSGPKRRDH